MQNKVQLNMLRYWRNTLADAARVEIPVGKTLNVKKVEIDFHAGTVEKEKAFHLIKEVEKRFNNHKGIKNRDNEKWQEITETRILIAPLRVSPIPEYSKLFAETGIFYPFWIRATLNQNGQLNLDEDYFPYIPRVYLEPQVNQDVNYTFSDVDRVDLAFSSPFNDKLGWKEYWSYILQTFKEVTNMDLDVYTSTNFTSTFENTIVVNETITSAADGIIQLYDHLIHEKRVPPLLESLCNIPYAVIKPLLSTDDLEKASVKHVGQMGFEYPLSISQRKSLYHFNRLAEGDILAVNGPPGTGKTTLLQSIVANEVVMSALKGAAPAVILACSTNNQAVTNIIDSFANVKQKQGLLYQRWLPKLKGFGLFLPSESKSVTDGVVHLKRKAGGFHRDIENKKYTDEAKKLFLSNFEQQFDILGLTLPEAVDWLHSHLTSHHDQIEQGVQIWEHYKNIDKLVKKLNIESGIVLFNNQELDPLKFKHIQETLKDLENKVSDYLDAESFLTNLFSFLPIIKNKRATRLKQIFRDCPLAKEGLDFYKLSTFSEFFDEKLNLLREISRLNQLWLSWKNTNQIEGNPPSTDQMFKSAEKDRRPFFYDELEMGIKYDMFYFAIHYWEGRWILDTDLALDEGRIKKNGISHAKNRWQRFAMLTPCFVSTFYMAPKFFNYSKFIKDEISDNKFEYPPLLEFIDLLIVDEAGQVSPEIGAATFALAKRSIVVGDTLQIEPVWSVPKKVDHANLERHQIVKSIADQEQLSDLFTKGFLSSSGSVMKLAQKASTYQLLSKMERGMLLIEHRRCFNEIIDYCNQLAYHGILEPKKGPSKNTPFLPMLFVDTDGKSVLVGTSRKNAMEAKQIMQWIKLNKDKILHHYQGIENAESLKDKRKVKRIVLSDIIGIITPFFQQKMELTLALSSLGSDASGITIGTVHALQGAERHIVLFSSTYGTNDSAQSYFFDAGVNMLNVAVSRAKETFVFFGSKRNFDKEGEKPSQQLYRHCVEMDPLNQPIL